MQRLEEDAMKMSARTYTYADYEKWEDDGKRWELIDGVPYMMAGPSTEHQRMVMEFSIAFGSYLKGKKCEVFASPIDVRLNFDKGDNTVVQPDLVIVCDKEKIDKKGIKGAPDIVIEVISPSSIRMDRVTKYKKYQKYGVKEYWIVNTTERAIEVHVLENEKYAIDNVYTVGDILKTEILEEFELNLTDVFGELPEDEE